MEKPEPINSLWVAIGGILIFAAVIIPVFRTPFRTPTPVVQTMIREINDPSVISHVKIAKNITVALIKDKDDCYVLINNKEVSAKLKVECD